MRNRIVSPCLTSGRWQEIASMLVLKSFSSTLNWTWAELVPSLIPTRINLNWTIQCILGTSFLNLWVLSSTYTIMHITLLWLGHTYFLWFYIIYKIIMFTLRAVSLQASNEMPWFPNCIIMEITGWPMVWKKKTIWRIKLYCSIIIHNWLPTISKEHAVNSLVSSETVKTLYLWFKLIVHEFEIVLIFQQIIIK